MKLKKDYIKFLIGEMSYKELSEKCGISSNWLNTVINRGQASMNIVNKLAKALNVEPIEIVKMED
ncbi:helix-turn-helix transcriptional regulator [Anaerococcus hydrogenalis]|uniref:helix-turn-helix transcriptional regulator n=1 Tax=Anaerococcus hydrogenalis TaxID=33029 RepID=UPI002900C402|nr:helix-turn-helix transcriptional regulator [Anaerococcus hydrogenalis]MDU1316913.1 helix-turn-helix transcriptional regulator [Anaerococcus hydrogenalis]